MKTMEEIISLCKRRGFIFQSADIYGGLQGVYDYGPLGIELKNNLKAAWWKDMVYKRNDIEGLDSSIITHREVLRKSGHEENFVDFITENNESPKKFNAMFKTNFGPTSTGEEYAYLRPETAQGIFTNLQNVLNCTNRKLPFGIAQIGKAFRNEITTKRFIFRTREFEQMEIEYFYSDEQLNHEEIHKEWVDRRFEWWKEQGLRVCRLIKAEANPDELAHYSFKTTDIMYEFPFGFGEIEGIASRGDFDIKNHNPSASGISVVEPSAGVDRGVLALLCDAYNKEKLENGSERVILKLKYELAPIKIAVIPLVKNDENIVSMTKVIFDELTSLGIGRIRYEDTGNIGKAYRRNDEIGTPFCITVDHQSIQDGSVTVRERDSMEQIRLSTYGNMYDRKFVNHIMQHFSI